MDKDKIFQAIKDNDLNKVIETINSGININYKDRDGWTALMHAANQGKLSIVRYLIERGAKIDAKDKFGFTAIMYASLNSRPEMVQYLLQFKDATKALKRKRKLMCDLFKKNIETVFCSIMEYK